jgi:hypothetical protein
MSDDRWFEQLAGAADASAAGTDRAPARLKSRVYSAVMRELAESGPLQDLADTRACGERLCVFEHVVSLMPVGPELRSKNLCAVCHARVLGERLERAPIFWSGCPYSRFHH